MEKVKPSVYLETTVCSYLTAWPSRDLIVATHQQITKDWWRTAHSRYDLCVSQTVLDEAAAGDAQAVEQRLEVLKNLVVLPRADKIQPLASLYVQLLRLPPKAIADAVHLAYAVLYEVDYLLTWNMRHLANSLTMRRLTESNLGQGLHVPLIVTPEYLVQAVE